MTDRLEGTVDQATVTLDGAQAAEQAARLDQAEQDRVQITQSTATHPEMTIGDAYAIQEAWRSIRLARGETIVGHKIGLTSRAMQKAVNIDTPDSGFLTDAMVFSSGDRVETARFTDAKVEVELAFVLGSTIDMPDPSIDQVLDATDHVVPAIELLAARTHRVDPDTGRTRTVIDTIADNAANAGIIVGDTRIGPRDLDLRWVHAILIQNDAIEETGVAAGVLGHPASGIVWLARRMAQRNERLEAGQVILSGSFTRPLPVQPGDDIIADFNQLGRVHLSFS